MHDGHDHVHHHHDHSHEVHSKVEIEALLSYMLTHNRHHAEELADMAHTLIHCDMQEASDAVTAAIADFEEGNKKLAKALELFSADKEA